MTITKEQENFEEATPAPRQTYSDIVGIHVLHGHARVQVRVRFVDLVPAGRSRGDAAQRLSVVVRTDRGMGREATFDFSSTRERVYFASLHPYGERAACAVTHAVDYRRNVVVVGIPRTCLGLPRWVRIGIAGIAWIHDKDETVAMDDALKTGYGPGNPPARLSPRIPTSG